MQQITRINIDVGSPTSIPPVVPAVQGDTGRAIMAAIADHGAPFNLPAGAVAVARIHKPDGHNCVYDAVWISGNVVMVLLVDQVLTAHGQALGEISVYTSEADRITSFVFCLDIQRSAVDDGEIVSTDYFNALTQLAGQILATSTMVKPLGFYATVDQLQAAVQTPNTGDMYGVGTAAPYDYYVWDGTTWVNNGKIGASDIPYLGVTQGMPGAMTLEYGAPLGNGQPFVFTPNSDVPLGATLNISGSGDYPVLNHDGTPIDAGMLYKDVPVIVVYRAASTSASAAYVVTLDGRNGYTYTPAVTDAGIISWTNDGGLPNPDPVDITGPKGDKGDTGRGLDILGTHADLAALQATVTDPKQGDMYNVGATEPYTIYMYDEVQGWISQGKLQGPEGPAGMGVPAGGTAGQLLTKTTDADYEAEWQDPPSGLPEGGTEGQVLTVLDDGPGWADPGMGIFSMHINNDGDLILTISDGVEPPPLSINDDGDLIYTII